MPLIQLRSQTMYYNVLGPIDGQPLLLMHGFMQIGRDLLVVANHLSAKGYFVILPDMPGYGRSVPPNRSFPADFYTRDALLIGEFLDMIGIHPAHIMGYSDGGEAALLMAILRPDQIRTCITWGSVGSLTTEAADYARLTLPVIDPAKRARHPGQYVEAWGQLWLAGFLSYERQGGDISLSRAAEIKCPLLMMVGERDGWNPPKEAQLFIEHANGANGLLHHLKVFSRVGHAIHEECPDDFLNTVTDFLSSCHRD